MSEEQSSAGDGKVIKSVERNLAILEELRRQHGVGVAELASALDASRSTVHHHLTTLRKHGYVTQRDGEYHLGIRYLSLGGEAIRTNDLLAGGTHAVNDLVDETGLTGRIAVEENGYVVCIYEEPGEAAGESAVQIGKQVRTWRSAIARAMLSQLSPERLEAVLDNVDEAPPSRAALDDALETVRERGVAFDDRERDAGAVAAPVTSINGELLGAISLTGAREHFEDDAASLADAVSTTAEVLQINTTYDHWMNTEP
jgi:DNA-binding IclR family transcriptional regulator